MAPNKYSYHYEKYLFHFAVDYHFEEPDLVLQQMSWVLNGNFTKSAWLLQKLGKKHFLFSQSCFYTHSAENECNDDQDDVY